MSDFQPFVARLGEACESLNRSREPDALPQLITARATMVFAAERCFLYLRGADGSLAREACHPATDEPTPLPELVGWVAEQAGPMLVDDVGAARGGGRETTDAGAEMAAPLAVAGRLLGALIIRAGAERFGPDHLVLLRIFAAHAAAALESARLAAETAEQVRQLDDRARRLDLLGRVARSLTRRLELDDLLAELLRLCTEAFELRHCAVLLLDPVTGAQLVRRAAIGYDARAPLTLAVGEGITGHVAATGVPLFVPDVSKDPRYVTGVSGGRAEMAVPLKVFGQVIGVLDAESAEPGEFDEQDLDLFASFAAQAAIAIRSADPTARSVADGSG